MKNNKKINYITAFLAGLILLGLDLGSKTWAVSDGFEPVNFIKNFFFLTNYQTNSGIAFGIHMPIWTQIIGSVIIIAILIRISKDLVFDTQKHEVVKPILFGIIIGGAIGNLVDRFSQGYVIDFIVLKPIPVFNIADIGITVGLIGLFAVTLMESKKNSKV